LLKYCIGKKNIGELPKLEIGEGKRWRNIYAEIIGTPSRLHLSRTYISPFLIVVIKPNSDNSLKTGA